MDSNQLLWWMKLEFEFRRRKSGNDLHNETFDSFLKRVTPDWTWDLPHFQILKPHLQQILDGTPKKILVMMPVRHGKSQFATVRFAAAYLRKYPGNRVVVGAYNKDFGTSFARAIKRILSREMVLSGINKAHHWETGVYNPITGEIGSLLAVGVGVGIAGKGCELLIIDDPFKNYEDAATQICRDRVWNWFLHDLSTRLDSKGSTIITMARWHYDDLIGHILQREDANSWTVIKITALAEENDILGREVGEALWPARYDKTYLENIRKGNPAFNYLYQQNPIMASGGIFKRSCWQYYTPQTKPPYDYILCSLDTACKTKEVNDRSVCTTWGVVNGRAYLEDIWVDRVDYNILKITLCQIADRYKPSMILIEDTSSGAPLIQDLSANSRLPIRGVIPRGDKSARAYIVTPKIYQGFVFLPQSHPLLLDFLDELAYFPKGQHDDIVDSVTQALNFIFYSYSSDPITFF